MSKIKPRILLIEDDPGVGRAMKEILEVFGYDVHWSPSANDAFDEIVDDGYRAAVLDLNLGKEHGVTLIASLRCQGHKVPPLVILSAQPYERLKDAATETGAVVALRKPASAREIAAAIEIALIDRDDRR